LLQRRAYVAGNALSVELDDDVGDIFKKRAIMLLALAQRGLGAAQALFASPDLQTHVLKSPSQLTHFVPASGNWNDLDLGFVFAFASHITRGYLQDMTSQLTHGFRDFLDEEIGGDDADQKDDAHQSDLPPDGRPDRCANEAKVHANVYITQFAGEDG